MAATPYTTVGDIANNLIFQIEDVVGMELLVVSIGAWILANPLVIANPLTEEEKNDMLRKLTGCTVATGTDLNCYPRGADLTTCFDLSGNEVP